MESKKSIYRDEYKAIIEWLVVKRQSAGFTQEHLAKKLKKPQSFVSKYENCERRLDLVEFIEICKKLKIDAKEMIEKIK